MDHHLVRHIEQALGWDGPGPMGRGFACGTMDDADVCTRLLTPTRLLDTVMRRSLAPPQFRCFRGGDELHPRDFLTPMVSLRGQSLSMANMDRLSHLIRNGCTLVLDAMDVFDPTMEIACRALQWWSHERVQVNTYLTTADAAGFSLHWDDHDVIVVQLAGEKSWEVRGASRVAPMHRDAAKNNRPSDEIVWTGTMRPGDVMHIPRGFWHQATRTDKGRQGYSLHATFGFVKRTGVDWLSWLADNTRRDERFRHDLNRWGTEADRTAQYDLLTQAFQDHLDQYDPDAYLAAREQEQPPPRYVHTAGVFEPLTDVVCVTAFPPHIEVTDDRVIVQAAGKRLELAGQAEGALRLLLSGRPVNLERVSQKTGVDALELAELLTEEGLCAELTDELSSGCTGLVPPASFSKTPSAVA
ncbi:JmjC domain-containing protein [Actinosynnema sp. CA-248983]